MINTSIILLLLLYYYYYYIIIIFITTTILLHERTHKRRMDSNSHHCAEDASGPYIRLHTRYLHSTAFAAHFLFQYHAKHILENG